VIAVALVVELAIIVGAAAAGTTSHFNVSTPLATAMWSLIAVSISVLWVATFVACLVLFRNPLGDRARTIAIRGGALISLVRLGLGYLMTSPTAAQLANFGGIADGGPGLPVLVWSTVAGDLRIPHFVGTVTAGYLAVVGLVTLQALRGQSIVMPDAVTLGLGAAIAAAMAAAAVVIVARGTARGR